MTTMLDRWQFGITTVYHFLFVPLTIGLALIVAVMQTFAYRQAKANGADGSTPGDWDRLARFFGTLFVINFAMGVVTGIVQEFQFGMNWSNYSIFVGNIFGAPLAMEGLLAFFMESTFLGLWIFGRDRLSPRLHLATIWLVALGTIVPFSLIIGSLQHLRATQAGIVGMTEPVVATLVAFVWLGEALGPAQLLGGAVVLSGVILAETARTTHP